MKHYAKKSSEAYKKATDDTAVRTTIFLRSVRHGLKHFILSIT